MAEVSIKINLGNSMNILDMFSNNAKKAQYTGVETVAMLLRDTMIKYAKAGHPDHPNVVTGRLSADSIGYTTISRIPAVIDVGSDAEYAPYVEFGHGHAARSSIKTRTTYKAFEVPAYPWFFPAINEVQDTGQAQKVFVNAVKEALGK